MHENAHRKQQSNLWRWPNSRNEKPTVWEIINHYFNGVTIIPVWHSLNSNTHIGCDWVSVFWLAVELVWLLSIGGLPAAIEVMFGLIELRTFRKSIECSSYPNLDRAISFLCLFAVDDFPFWKLRINVRLFWLVCMWTAPCSAKIQSPPNCHFLFCSIGVTHMCVCLLNVDRVDRTGRSLNP